MYVIKEGEDLTLVNTVRLNDAGLAALDKLGKVKNIIRIAGFHGMDDPFYKSRYNVKLYSVDAPFAKGVSTEPAQEDIYFEADEILKSDSELPIANASYLEISSSQPKEGILLLNRDGGIAITGDSMQNWEQPDEFFNFVGGFVMKRAGFIRAYNIGPGWLQYAKPDLKEVLACTESKFENLLPSHGSPVLGGAYQKYVTTLEKIMKK